jgi:hypothetical protein
VQPAVAFRRTFDEDRGLRAVAGGRGDHERRSYGVSARDARMLETEAR